MGPHKGYYSLIQFCPDRGRAEAVNIGLLLFVPDTGHLDIRTVRTTGRVARVFGRGAVDPWWLKTAREAFVRGMRTEHKAGRFAVASDLDKYLATLGNDIIPTPLRATRVDDTAADMARLFARLVELTPEPPKRDVPPVARPIDDVFTDLSMRMVRVGIGRSFRITGLDYRIKSDYDYRNGTANLIRLLRVGSSRPGRAVKEAIDLGGESVQVENHLIIDRRRAKLIVVVTPEVPSEKTREVEQEIRRIDRDYPAQYVLSDEIPDFADRVRAEAM